MCLVRTPLFSAGFVKFSRRTRCVRNEKIARCKERTRLLLPSIALPLSLPRTSDAKDRKRKKKREREKYFSILARVRNLVPRTNANFISSIPARGAVFTKESTLSRYFHGTACENVNFILPPHRQILYAIPVRFLDGIEYALTARGADRTDKSARMLSKELLHGSYGVIRMEICINRQCIPNSRRKRDI